MQHQTLCQMLLSNDRNKNIPYMTEHSVCSVECSEPTSFFSFIFMLRSRKDLPIYIEISNTEHYATHASVAFFSKLPWMWKILLLHVLMGSSVNRDTDHNFKSIFMGIKMFLTVSSSLKWMTLAVSPDCCWLALLLHYQHQNQNQTKKDVSYRSVWVHKSTLCLSWRHNDTEFGVWNMFHLLWQSQESS